MHTAHIVVVVLALCALALAQGSFVCPGTIQVDTRNARGEIRSGSGGGSQCWFVENGEVLPFKVVVSPNLLPDQWRVEVIIDFELQNGGNISDNVQRTTPNSDGEYEICWTPSSSQRGLRCDNPTRGDKCVAVLRVFWLGTGDATYGLNRVSNNQASDDCNRCGQAELPRSLTPFCGSSLPSNYPVLSSTIAGAAVADAEARAEFESIFNPPPSTLGMCEQGVKDALCAVAIPQCFEEGDQPAAPNYCSGGCDAATASCTAGEDAQIDADSTNDPCNCDSALVAQDPSSSSTALLVSLALVLAAILCAM